MNSLEPVNNPYAAPKAKDIPNQADDTLQEVKFFAVNGRMGRVRYIVNLIGAYLLMGMAGAALTPVLGKSVPYLVLAVYAVMFVMLTIQRCHDTDISGWWSIAAFFPLAVIIFCLIPGTNGANRWGNKTVPNTTLSVILACALTLIFVAGIVAAIAIPAYQGYSKAANATQRN